MRYILLTVLLVSACSGEAGPVGPEGLQGERGLQGDRGERGPEGPPGPQGVSGDPEIWMFTDVDIEIYDVPIALTRDYVASHVILVYFTWNDSNIVWWPLPILENALTVSHTIDDHREVGYGLRIIATPRVRGDVVVMSFELPE